VGYELVVVTRVVFLATAAGQIISEVVAVRQLDASQRADAARLAP